MTKTKALASARDEINLGMDGTSVRVYDHGGDATRVMQATDYHAARSYVTELRVERTLQLLGHSVSEAYYLAGTRTEGRLEDRVNAALEAPT